MFKNLRIWVIHDRFVPSCGGCDDCYPKDRRSCSASVFFRDITPRTKKDKNKTRGRKFHGRPHQPMTSGYSYKLMNNRIYREALYNTGSKRKREFVMHPDIYKYAICEKCHDNGIFLLPKPKC